MKRKLEGRIALITGASRGIGAAVAKRFAREGAHVILVARTIGALEAIDDEIQQAGGQSTLVPMDLLKQDLLDLLGKTIAERFGKLDILVGNAAMLGGLSPMVHYTPEIWDKVIQLNLNSQWRLLRSVHPLLKQSEAGRVIMVTSGITKEATPYWGPYAVSKAALEMMVRTYAAENETISHIKANLLNPGMIATNMLSEAMPGIDLSKQTSPESITQEFVQLASVECQANGQLFSCQAKR